MKIERLVLETNGHIEAFGIDVPPEELERLEKLLRTLSEIQRESAHQRGEVSSGLS